MTVETLLLRFLACVSLAFLFGFARQKFGKPVGFGTFVFVTIGACGVAMTAIRLSPPPLSPLPLLAAIITGIGFLGAGALVRTGDRITGFTSASTIWIMAVFGMAVGVGEGTLAAVLYASVWAVVLIEYYLETHGRGAHTRSLALTVDLERRTPVEQALADTGARLSLESTRFERDTASVSLKYRLSGHQAELEVLAGVLLHVEGVQGFQIE